MDVQQLTNEPSESASQDFRQLLAQKKKLLNGREGSRIRSLLATVRWSRAIDWLESSSGSLSAVCLCLVLGGVSLFLIQRYYAHADFSGDIDAANELESLQAEPTSGATFGEEVGDLTDGLIQYGPSGATEDFFVRVGVFRDPSNAKRVAESLHQKSLEVRTVVRADGLHVVTLGPFSRKGAAEEVARSVQETLGLVPQILRTYLR
jgi:SPOR domain